MQIVIELPDDEWKSYQPYKGLPYDNIMGNSVRYIANGTPLPKGHGRLIDVSKLRQDIFDDKCWWYTTMESPNEGYSLKTIREAETIIEADGGGEDADSD